MLSDRGAHVIGRRGQHRLHRTTHLQADGLQPLGPGAQRDLRGHREVAREHRRSAHQRRLRPGSLRDRVGHQPRQRTLAQLADQQPAHEVTLGLGAASEERCEQVAPCPHRTLAGRVLHLRQQPVEVGHGDRRRGRRNGLEPADGGPAHPDAPLPGFAGEETHHRPHVGFRRAGQQLREGGDLLRPFRGCRHHLGRGDQIGQWQGHGHQLTNATLSRRRASHSSASWSSTRTHSLNTFPAGAKL